MMNRLSLLWRTRTLLMVVFGKACLAVWLVAFPAARADAGSLVIPAWAFDRGNVQIHADPGEYADAGPVVVSGDRKPWGWSVEYDIEVPVAGSYNLWIRYASAESRPVQVYFDNVNQDKACNEVSLAPASAAKPNIPTWKSSGARWEVLRTRFGRPAGLSGKGKHTIRLTSRTPLPHLVALRLDTEAAFPENWTPPRYKVRDLDSIPEKFRAAFTRPGDVDVAALRQPVKGTPDAAPGGLEIPAWTFDRARNALIYASPDQYADNGPVVGSKPGLTDGEEAAIEFDIEFPADNNYALHFRYVSAEARPVEVSVDGKPMGMGCIGATYGSAPYEQPVVFTSNSSGEPTRWEGVFENGQLARMPIAKGKHTLKFARRGPLPNLIAVRVSPGWDAPPRRVRHFNEVPVRDRAVFLPPDAVNVDALREAIRDTIKTFGSRYPGGETYLKRLAELEKNGSSVFSAAGGRDGYTMTRTWASEEGKPEAERTVEGQLAALRREAMLAHPALAIDKLLFVKKTPNGGHIYEGHLQRQMGGSLCVLSPVSPDGKVTDLAPQLAGGRFSRFDISFDGRKVVFGYMTKDGPFRIYEIGADGTGLRQLTSFEGSEAKSIHDSDPIYLPNGKIMFVSSRCRQAVFCFPATVSNMYVMDGDGTNVRRLSYSPLTEMGPSLLDDGRVAYTRWEYVDKGLGNGQGLWSMRWDGSGVDHVYKNSITRPSGMLYPRSVPHSRLFVTVGNSHMSQQGGPVILIDNRTTRRSTEAMTCITPEIGYPCMYTAKWAMGFFQDPYPFSEKFFLVSHIPGGKDEKAQYGIYVLDAWGNRAKLYDDPEISCFQPVPLLPRRMPVDIASSKPVRKEAAVGGLAGTDDSKKAQCTMFIQDVYEGLTGIERGRVKYVRVMGVLPWPWDENGMFRIGLPGDVHRKRVYGVAKVHEDGSAFFTVPAEENIFFQVLDENYMLLQHMPTFINMMPGEKRGCIGCHEHRRKVPSVAGGMPLAMNHPVQELAPQPGDAVPRMVHYATDVQATLDKHCVGCHSGPAAAARLDLTGAPTESWCRSYENILGRGLVGARECGFGRSGFRPGPPLSFGSHVSKLAYRIREAPCKAGITQDEFVRITTWIDANTPYYGTYRGKRDLQYKDDPDFRLAPLAAK